jgi:hypothetical protein
MLSSNGVEHNPLSATDGGHVGHSGRSGHTAPGREAWPRLPAVREDDRTGGGPDEGDPEGRLAPAPLRVAAGLVLVEGLLSVMFGIVEAVNVDADRVMLGATTALFFVLYGAALGWCAWGMTHGRTWSRSPVVLAQLILLGLAWNLRNGGTLAIGVGMALVAVTVLAGVLHPASVDALNREEHRRR